ncbi:Glycosyltransferase, catalytic subunit of cellulose synthase and poly-beta-1,6-N-acetylglucosamine synthase [Paracoccus seriniphilus]|uniref:Glycosyltransferase, catalytic subunit of cellulose synthase and poly-beta-1,6-N-acetylglucosamine synthase n=2 Tax=Paracoccus seriniphilus TaxID=184748 RepID=A0A239PPP1_9RHOB|nr:Glycosyltransferase, catalytic subunit of cellulose synthase and poly-beta-1,6-N-acetylglucosamine synthase [Paracoccus seriniphilus]
MSPLGKILVEDGAVDAGNLLKAIVMRQRQNVRLGKILLTHGWVTPQALTRALSRQWRTSMLDPAQTPVDPRLIDIVGVEFCLSHGILPWRRIGGTTWVATAHPETFEDLRPHLPEELGRIRMLLCSEEQIRDAILSTRRGHMIRAAEMRVPAADSCRSRNEALIGRIAVLLVAALASALWFYPSWTFALLTGIVTIGLIAQTGLKLTAFLCTLWATVRSKAGNIDLPGHSGAKEMNAPLPVISVIVPLFEESDVAGRLVARLSRLSYPRELTDIVLAVEESDAITLDALGRTALPHWIRVVEVPDGPIKTKPRALNYALNFCHGQIVGIWDAEDRPDPDQLHRIARHFHFAAPETGCIQGALDYYNPRTNWLARCFTVEYAAWFRVLLPGIARLGLVVPLGGTTCFFRREALDDVDAWDAWNVTEDADLGVRLARRGWRTEIVETTTDEEANCRVLPWIRQRSRWLKGFALTWGVHMRHPARLWQELGPRRFIGFQVQFLAMLTQYLLAPMLWSFWLLALGLAHPVSDTLEPLTGGHAITALIVLFLTSEMIGLIIGLYAVRGTKHRHLLPWVPTLHVYFPLGCFAGWKAIHEIIAKPFYWDKTAHGIYDATDSEEQPVQIPGTIVLPTFGPINDTGLSDLSEPKTFPALASSGSHTTGRIARAG